MHLKMGFYMEGYEVEWNRGANLFPKENRKEWLSLSKKHHELMAKSVEVDMTRRDLELRSQELELAMGEIDDFMKSVNSSEQSTSFKAVDSIICIACLITIVWLFV